MPALPAQAAGFSACTGTAVGLPGSGAGDTASVGTGPGARANYPAPAIRDRLSAAPPRRSAGEPD